MSEANQELADDQLNSLLEELGVLTPIISKEPLPETPSLDHIVKEIFELTDSPPPFSSLPLEKEKKKKRFSILSWVVIGILFGGCAGFTLSIFWTPHKNTSHPIIKPDAEISEQISYWISELKTLYQQLEPTIPKNEIIAPYPSHNQSEFLGESVIR
ncbi:MAG: hypothetical protein R3E91_04375 [Chlamydiales bacterium]